MPQMQRLNDWPSSLKRIDSLEYEKMTKGRFLTTGRVVNSEGGGVKSIYTNLSLLPKAVPNPGQRLRSLCLENLL